MPFWISPAAVDRVCVIEDERASYRAMARPTVVAGAVSQRAAVRALSRATKRFARRALVTLALILAPFVLAVALRAFGLTLDAIELRAGGATATYALRPSSTRSSRRRAC